MNKNNKKDSWGTDWNKNTIEDEWGFRKRNSLEEYFNNLREENNKNNTQEVSNSFNQQQGNSNINDSISIQQQNANYNQNQNMGQVYGKNRIIQQQVPNQMSMQGQCYAQGYNQMMQPMNNGMVMQGHYPQPQQINEKELLKEAKKAPIGLILIFLHKKMERIKISSNIAKNEVPIEDKILIYPYSLPDIDMEKEINVFKSFISSYEVKEKIEDLILKSQNIKTINGVIFTNFNEYGYWESFKYKKNIDKIKIFQGIISITGAIETINYNNGKALFIEWADNNTMQKIYSKFFKEIEDDIVLNEKFDFKNNGKSLKELVIENKWINFKNYIVNYETLEVLQKKVCNINGLKIASGFFENEERLLEEIPPFDSYIDVDPLVTRTPDGKLELKNENEINKDMLDYICETMFGGDKEKVQLLLQHLGYSIYPKKNKKKALFMIGPANTGKSEIYELFKSYFPENLRSGYKLQKLDSDAAREKLMNSKINITDESSKKPISFDAFKNIVSGGSEAYNISSEPKEGFYNVYLVFFANEFIKPLNRTETKECPTGYLDKFSIIRTQKLSKDEKYKMTLGKEEFENKIVSEDSKQTFITMALYELKYLVEREFEFIETQEEIKEKKKHAYQWVQNELKRKRSIEDIMEEFEDFEYSPFNEVYGDAVEVEDFEVKDYEYENNNTGDTVINYPSMRNDIYAINSFIRDKIEFCNFNQLDIDIHELEELDFPTIKRKIYAKIKPYKTYNCVLYREYQKYSIDNINKFSSDDFINALRKKLINVLGDNFIDVVDYKKNMDKSEKKLAGEKYKNIILKAINENGYIIFYDEISAKKENGKPGTLTAFCGLKLK